MNKIQYQKEITIKQVMRKGSPAPQNKNVQEWLMLYKQTQDKTFNHTLSIDGDFGAKTEAAVKDFQKAKGLEVDGIVGQNTYRKLVEPMIKAFTKIDGKTTIRDYILAYAEQHVASEPYEMGGPNCGPWVRSYMDGLDGKKMLWCMGFVQMIMDQAFFTLGQDFTTSMPHSYSCDEVANKGKVNKRYISNKDAQANPSIIQPGDLFLRFDPKNPQDWTHTGIIVAIEGTKIKTIEGNTNEQGSREGVKVGALSRDLKTGELDIYRTLI